jgi:hypothetical protein
METSRLCHHADSCRKPATYVCAGCGWHYCGNHILQASFSGPGPSAVPLAVATCQACLAHLVAQQHHGGRMLRHWHKAG